MIKQILDFFLPSDDLLFEVCFGTEKKASLRKINYIFSFSFLLLASIPTTE
jgi:hypothetical protein